MGLIVVPEVSAAADHAVWKCCSDELPKRMLHEARHVGVVDPDTLPHARLGVLAAFCKDTTKYRIDLAVERMSDGEVFFSHRAGRTDA